MKTIKLTEDLNRTKELMGLILEQYEGGSIKKGDEPCHIWCKVKLAKRGSNGDVVKMIQFLLSADGILGDFSGEYGNPGVNEGCGSDWTKCDGKYGTDTEAAVEEFQKLFSGLQIDGKVGENTLNALCEAIVQEWVEKYTHVNMKGFILCDKQCNCNDIKIDIEIEDSDDITDVIDNIGGDPDLDDWYIEIPQRDDGDHWNSCKRIKACLYYASRKDSLIFSSNFINCMQGKFPERERK